MVNLQFNRLKFELNEWSKFFKKFDGFKVKNSKESTLILNLNSLDTYRLFEFVKVISSLMFINIYIYRKQ